MKEHKCGLCGEVATIGPVAGGPFAWYCKRCRSMVKKFLKAVEKHHIFIQELANVKIKRDSKAEVTVAEGDTPNIFIWLDKRTEKELMNLVNDIGPSGAMWGIKF